MDDLAAAYRGWIEDAMSKGVHRREGKWTESVAVGSELFVNATKEKLGIKGQGREVIGADGSYELRESSAAYKAILGHENDVLSSENGYFWNDTVGMSAS
jgi:putative transposase